MIWSVGLLLGLAFLVGEEFQGCVVLEGVVPLGHLLHVGQVEAVLVVAGQGLLEEGLELLGIGLGAGGVFVSQDLVQLGEHFLQLHLALGGVNGYVLQGGDAGIGAEIIALLVLKGFHDGAGAGLGDIVEKSVLSTDGKSFG